MHHTRKRIVTGIDDRGRSVIVSAETAPVVNDVDGWTTEEHWLIEGMPPALDEVTNAADDRDFDLRPPPGGTIYRVVTFKGGKGPMHTTETIDLGVIISGEIHLVMEEGEVLLNAGDTFIQRRTHHAWDNRSGQDCVLAGVLISSLPAEQASNEPD